MASKGCWTCKDRKVSCDRTIPNCLRCKNSSRVCAGYGVRLMWPKEDCNRASVSNKCSNPDRSILRKENYQWINVVSTDVLLHLAASRVLGEEGKAANRERVVFPSISELRLPQPSHVAAGDMDLIKYFDSVVTSLLPLLSINRTRLSYILIYSALHGNTQSSKAVYHSILALAAYHRGNDLVEVHRLKHAALRNLIIDNDPTMCQGIQHVAANLLLCVLSLQQTSGSYSECRSDWIGYIVGSKKVINAPKREEHEFEDAVSIVLGWFYYFDVMARFSFRHWRTEHIKAHAKELGFDPRGSQICRMQYILARGSLLRGIPSISAYAHPVVRLLAEVSEIGIYSSDPGYLSIDYQRRLDDLRLALENVSSYPVGLDTLAPQEVDHEQHLLEISRLAGLIYLERVSRNFSSQSTKLESWTKQALSIFAQLESCLCPFALFIISCELEKDEDRMIILNIFAKMEKGFHLKSILETRSLIQTAWNQQDLAEGGRLEYIHKLNLVVSSRDIVPSLI